jgi:hypothetical protein
MLQYHARYFGNTPMAKEDATQKAFPTAQVSRSKNTVINQQIMWYNIDHGLNANTGIVINGGILHDVNIGANGLSSYLRTVSQPTTVDEREDLIFLIKTGTDIHGRDSTGYTVAQYAYSQRHGQDSAARRAEDVYYGYRGDLWDVALAACGHCLDPFRRNYPRQACYTAAYSRSNFERLWAGYEHLCPYWDDGIFPSTGDHN